VACLYFSVYAAVNLYGFISSGSGLAGMVAVTALAVGLSLRHGAPIALMGFIGGFLTPLLTMIQGIGCSLDYLLHFEEFGVQGFGWSALGARCLGVAVLGVVLKWFGDSLQESVRKWGG
jgi:hypothetical protein